MATGSQAPLEAVPLGRTAGAATATPARRGCVCRASGKKVRKTFAREAEAKSGGPTRPPRTGRAAPDEPRHPHARRGAERVRGGDARRARCDQGRGRLQAGHGPLLRRAVSNYIAARALGAVEGREVRRHDVQAFADELLAAGLAAGTVSNVLNPRPGVLPAGDRPRRARQQPGRADRRAGAAKVPADADRRPPRGRGADRGAARGDRPLWATAFYAGLRRGELQALRVATSTWARA